MPFSRFLHRLSTAWTTRESRLLAFAGEGPAARPAEGAGAPRKTPEQKMQERYARLREHDQRLDDQQSNVNDAKIMAPRDPRLRGMQGSVNAGRRRVEIERGILGSQVISQYTRTPGARLKTLSSGSRVPARNDEPYQILDNDGKLIEPSEAAAKGIREVDFDDYSRRIKEEAPPPVDAAPAPPPAPPPAEPSPEPPAEPRPAPTPRPTPDGVPRPAPGPTDAPAPGPDGMADLSPADKNTMERINGRMRQLDEYDRQIADRREQLNDLKIQYAGNRVALYQIRMQEQALNRASAQVAYQRAALQTQVPMAARGRVQPGGAPIQNPLDDAAAAPAPGPDGQPPLSPADQKTMDRISKRMAELDTYDRQIADRQEELNDLQIQYAGNPVAQYQIRMQRQALNRAQQQVNVQRAALNSQVPMAARGRPQVAQPVQPRVQPPPPRPRPQPTPAPNPEPDTAPDAAAETAALRARLGGFDKRIDDGNDNVKRLEDDRNAMTPVEHDDEAKALAELFKAASRAQGDARSALSDFDMTPADKKRAVDASQVALEKAEKAYEALRAKVPVQRRPEAAPDADERDRYLAEQSRALNLNVTSPSIDLTLPQARRAIATLKEALKNLTTDERDAIRGKDLLFCTRMPPVSIAGTNLLTIARFDVDADTLTRSLGGKKWMEKQNKIEARDRLIAEEAERVGKKHGIRLHLISSDDELTEDGVRSAMRSLDEAIGKMTQPEKDTLTTLTLWIRATTTRPGISATSMYLSAPDNGDEMLNHIRSEFTKLPDLRLRSGKIDALEAAAQKEAGIPDLRLYVLDSVSLKEIDNMQPNLIAALKDLTPKEREQLSTIGLIMTPTVSPSSPFNRYSDCIYIGETMRYAELLDTIRKTLPRVLEAKSKKES